MTRRARVIVPVVVVLVGAVVVGLAFLLRIPQASGSTIATFNPGSTAAAVYTLEKVTSTKSQEQGLRGRDTLADKKGMYFDYGQTSGKRCIWMKDMKFNIDVIWVDKSERIVSAVSNLSPSTYPQTYCAQAVGAIEVPAMTIRQQGLRPGQIITID